MFTLSKHILSWKNSPENEKFNFNMKSDIEKAKKFLGNDLLDIWYVNDGGNGIIASALFEKIHIAVIRNHTDDACQSFWDYGEKIYADDIKEVSGSANGARLVPLSDVAFEQEQKDENEKIANFLLNLRDEFYDKLTENSLRGVYFYDSFISALGTYDNIMASIKDNARHVRFDELKRLGQFVLFNKNTESVQHIKFEVLRDLLFGAKYS